MIPSIIHHHQNPLEPLNRAKIKRKIKDLLEEDFEADAGI
jgi:hypothetical protein